MATVLVCLCGCAKDAHLMGKKKCQCGTCDQFELDGEVPTSRVLTTVDAEAREATLVAAGFQPATAPLPVPDLRPEVTDRACRCTQDLRPIPPRVSVLKEDCPIHGDTAAEHSEVGREVGGQLEGYLAGGGIIRIPDMAPVGARLEELGRAEKERDEQRLLLEAAMAHVRRERDEALERALAAETSLSKAVDDWQKLREELAAERRDRAEAQAELASARTEVEQLLGVIQQHREHCGDSQDNGDVAPAVVLYAYDAWSCLTARGCGARYTRETATTGHSCGPLTPVTVTITRQPEGQQ